MIPFLRLYVAGGFGTIIGTYCIMSLQGTCGESFKRVYALHTGPIWPFLAVSGVISLVDYVIHG